MAVLGLALLGLPLWGACAEPLNYLIVETEVQELCIVDMATDFPANEFPGAEGSVSQVLGGDELGIVVSGAGEEPVQLMDYAAAEDRADSLFIESASAVDIAVFLGADDLEFLVEFEGAVPDDAWAANLEVCLSAQATYRESL